MTARIIDPESGESSKPEVDYFMPDISWRDFPVSIKRSFLVLAEQALKTSADSIEFEITSDGKAHIALIIGNRSMPIVQISSGIFDRYWAFLRVALKSPHGLKIKKSDDIYDFSGEPAEMLSGRKITLGIVKKKAGN